MGRRISIKCILLIFLTFTICCNCQSENPVTSSWAKLEISPNTLNSMEYGNFRIEIYEHAHNHKAATTAIQKKYFYSPLSLLDHKSAHTSYNNVTQRSEMRFRVEMWNDKVQNEVVKHLNEIVDHEIKSNQVAIIPLEKVILTSNVPTADYSLSPEWTNYDKSKILRLSLTCFDRKVCGQLANEMKSNPKQFDHFKLLYSLSSQTSQTKETTISINSVTSGSMVSKLLQKFEDKNEIFLTANDEKKMLTETATNIRMETFDDSEVVSPDTETQIVNILKEMLITSRTTIKEQRDKMWDSVFWNDDNYRPDKTTKTLNEILDKLDTETQKKLANLFKKTERQSGMKLTLDEDKSEKRFQHNYDANSWTDVDKISSIISGKLANDSDRVEISKEDMEKLLQESRKNVEWDGEKFVPKPTQLSRINLGTFRDSQSFQDRNVRVHYTNAELSAPIKLMEHAELTVTDEWGNLKEQLKEAVKNLVKSNEELNNVKRDLTNKLEETRRELDKTKTELEKTRTGLSKTVDNLSEKINETSTTMTKMLNDRTSEIVDIGQMPTSCSDLERMGHKLSGFFSVKGPKQMEMVYCDFFPNQNGKQMRIGYFNVKSEPVYFYVQRNSTFNTTGSLFGTIFALPQTAIPFQLEVVNEGNAMNLTSGIFTAPRPGIYFFSFTGLAGFPESSSDSIYLGVGLYLNGVRIGAGWVEELNTVAGQSSPLTVQSTLKLKEDDEVCVAIYGMSPGAYLYDSSWHYTHFTGFLLQEDIVESL